ncbi:MAG: hypothetical protein ACKVWV_12105 [Planctomycetota bacterium]
MSNARILGVLALLALGTTARADHLITRKVHVDGYTAGDKTVPGSDTTHNMWIGSDRLRFESSEGTVIVRVDQSKLYMLDAKAKTATSIDLPFDLVKYLPPEAAGMADQIKAMSKISATVTPSDETKKVGEWNTRKYTVAMRGPQGPMSDEVMWVTKDVRGIDVAKTRDMLGKLFSVQPGGESVAEEMKKIDGIAVLTERTRSRGGNSVKSSEEVVSIESKDAPAGTYDVPADYTTKPFDLMSMGGGMGGGRPGGRPATKQ